MKRMLESDPTRRAVVWVPDERAGRVQLLLPTLDDRGALAIRGRSQVLVYGNGSSGKAGLAMALAFEPRYPVDGEREGNLPWDEYLVQHKTGSTEWYRHLNQRWANRARVLVVSFLYSRDYYDDMAETLFQKRFRLSEWKRASQHVTTHSYYPGYID